MTGKKDLHALLGLGLKPDAATIIIFSEQINERLNYVCRFIFEHVLKIKYVLTSGNDEFQASRFFKINYSHDLINSAFHIIPAGLLNESSVNENKPEAVIKDNCLYFYNTEKADLHFDIFSAVFFMISRYEEWQTFAPDAHKRFELDQSILFKYKMHLKPVTDIWIMELRRALAKFYPQLLFPAVQYKTISTIDVDNLYAYAHKDFIRTLGAGVKDIFKGDFKNLSRRLKTITKQAVDPFDIYDSFSKYCNELNIPLIYFFLYRTGTSFDRTVKPTSPAFKNVFNKIQKNSGIIGLHPSYYSSENEYLLKSEIAQFSKALEKTVNLSRQHYLKFNIKSTPQQLIQNGIKTDFSMGFASGPGFRAGTSFPFYYYNFNEEKESELLLVPFCAMDGAYTIYNSTDPQQAFTSLQQLKEEVINVHGLFITVFHERTFAQHLHPGFADMYKNLLK